MITTVAEVAGDDPVGLDPLYEAIDPDSLDRILASTGDSPGAPRAGVEFAYCDYWVVVRANGRGYVLERDDRPAAATPLAELANGAE